MEVLLPEPRPHAVILADAQWLASLRCLAAKERTEAADWRPWYAQAGAQWTEVAVKQRHSASSCKGCHPCRPWESALRQLLEDWLAPAVHLSLLAEPYMATGRWQSPLYKEAAKARE